MTPISHGLIPLALGYRWLPRTGDAPAWRVSLAVAIFGVLPDLLDPHLRLSARHASWSHTLAAWIAVSAGLLLWAVIGKGRFDRRTLGWCSLAYLAHLLCDASSGGVALFRPGSGRVFGGAYVTPVWWIVSDGALLVWFYFVYRWLPQRARRLREKREASGEFVQ